MSKYVLKSIVFINVFIKTVNYSKSIRKKISPRFLKYSYCIHIRKNFTVLYLYSKRFFSRIFSIVFVFEKIIQASIRIVFVFEKSIRPQPWYECLIARFVMSLVSFRMIYNDYM